MSRRRRLAILAALAAVPLAAGCGARTSNSSPASGSSTSASIGSAGSASAARAVSSTTGARPPSAGATPASVATAFAAAYARYLDGLLPDAALPDATAAARAQAGPVIPPADRAGALAVASVQALAGGQTFAVQLRDRAHTFAAQIAISRAGSGWLIAGVQAPDLDSILHTRSGPIPQPSGSEGAEQAARAFMGGYLPWLYGEGRVGQLRDATPALLAQLKAHPPNIPPSLQGLHARLAALGMQRQAAGWQAQANVTDGRQTYDLTLAVVSDHGRWLVSSVTYPH